MLLDLQTGDIVDEFQQYVQPQECPILSTFCKELTGISQVYILSAVYERLNLSLSLSLVGSGGWWDSPAHLSLSVWEVGGVSEGGEEGVSHGAGTRVQQPGFQLVCSGHVVR